MKFILKSIAVGALVALALAGCSSPTSSGPSYPSLSTATVAEAAISTSASDADNDGFDAADAGSTVTGISYTGSTSAPTYDVTVTFTNYVNTDGDTINGSLHFTQSINGSKVTATQSGTLNLSNGPNGTATVVVNLTLTVTVSGSTAHLVNKGTITINGKVYSDNFSQDLPISSSSPVHLGSSFFKKN
jgi:hypothetical protein